MGIGTHLCLLYLEDSEAEEGTALWHPAHHQSVHHGDHYLDGAHGQPVPTPGYSCTHQVRRFLIFPFLTHLQNPEPIPFLTSEESGSTGRERGGNLGN